MEEVWHKGQCHCGHVQFEVHAPKDVTVHACNCSMCMRHGFLHLIVPKAKFRLLKGADNLTEYRFNTGVAQHLFCKTCGVEGFYVPRSNPDGWSVNMRALDQAGFDHIDVQPFDGQNWEAHAHALKQLSQA